MTLNAVLGLGVKAKLRNWYLVLVHQVNSAFHPSRVGKSRTGLLAGVKLGYVHLCRVAGNNVVYDEPATTSVTNHPIVNHRS